MRCGFTSPRRLLTKPVSRRSQDMVTPTRKGSSIGPLASRIAPVAVRVAFALALLVLAVQLHGRSGDLDRRERSLRLTLDAVARRESVNDRRERHLHELAGRLEQVIRT